MTEAETWQQESKSLTLYIYDSAGAIAHTITNDSIKSESMELSQTLEASNALAFKGCNAAVFKISLTDLADDVRGCRLKAVLAAGTYSYTIFDGIIEEQENQTHEDILTSLTAYDYMRQINGLDVTEWAKALTGITGLTAFELLQKFFDEVISVNFSVVTMTDTGENWNSTVFTSEPDFSQFDSITGETFIKWLCQCGNVYGYMSVTELSFLKLETFDEPLYPALDLYPSGSLYPSDGSSNIKKITKSNYISLDYEPYKVANIGGVVVCDSEGIGEGIAPGESAASNSLYIDSNPLAWAMDMETLAADIYARVKDLTFTPVDIDTPGMPFINLGDIVRASTNKRTVHTYILKRTLKGIQALRDNFDSSADQYQPSHADTYSSISSATGKKILKVQADMVEMNAATIKELHTNYITAKEISTNYVTAQTLQANYLTAKQIQTDYVTSKTLTSDYITAAAIKTAYMEVDNWASNGFIKAAKIAADTFSGRTVSAYDFSATYFTQGGYNFANESITYLDKNGTAHTKVFLTGQK